MAKQKTELEFSLIDGVSKGMSAIFKGMTDIGVSIQKVTGFAGDLSNALGGVNLLAPLQAIPAALVDLESAMSRAGQATKATDEQLAQLRDTAQEASAAVGFSAVEGAQALTALGLAGLNATEAMTALVPVLALAKTANIAVEDAAGRVADKLDQFQLAANQAANVANILAAAAAASGTNFKQLDDGLAKAGPSAFTAGVAFETAAAALGLLAKNGIEGTRAGRDLDAVFVALKDPTSAFSKALTEANITSRDFSVVLDELSRKGAVGQTAINALGKSGREAMTALLREGGGALQKFTTEIKNSEDAALRAAKLINDNLSGAFKELQNTVINAGTDFFEPILGPLQQGLLDASAAIAAFAASPEFAALRESFRVMFTEAGAAARSFVKELDFTETLASIKTFTTDAAAAFKELNESIDFLTKAFKVLEPAVMLVPNALGAASDAASRAAAKLASVVSIPLGLISDDAEAARQAVDRFANEGLANAEESASEFGKGVTDAANTLLGLDGKVKDSDSAITRAAKSIAEYAAKTFSAGLAAIEANPAFNALKDAIAKTGEAGTDAATKLDAAKQQLIGFEGAVTAAIRAGSSEDSIKILTERVVGATKEVQALQKAADEAAAKLKKTGDDAKDSFSGAADAVRDTTEAIYQTAETTSRAANSAEAGTASLKDAVGGLYSFFAQTSKAAADLFAELQTGANFGSIGLESYGKAIEAADQGTQRAIATAKAFGETSIAAFNDFAESGKIAGNEAAGAFFTTAGALDTVEQAIKAGVGAFGLMDAQTLSNVQAALDRARSKVQAIEAAARSATDSLAAIGDQLEEQALRDSGNEEEIARRAYERKVQEIQALAETAGAAGQAAAARAEALARDELNRALKRIAEKKAAEIAAANETADARIAANARVDSAQTTQAAASSAGQITPRTNAQTAAAAATIAPQRAGDNFSLNVQLGTIPENRAQLDRLARQLLERIKELQRLSR